MNYFDTHSHLAMLEHDALDNILARARQAGVTRMLTVSTERTNWEKNRDIALANEGITYSVGVHPHDAAAWENCGEALDAWFASGVPPKCVGIGELGLDYHYNLSPREAQIAALEAQFAVARRVELPVIIHCRESFRDLYDAIRRVGLSTKAGVMHCFTGGPAEAREALDLGLSISFSGILTFKNAGPIREAAGIIPEDRLLLETDCPFLAPIPNRGKPNEPGYLPHTALVLAQSRGEPLDRVAEATTRNAMRLFAG